MFKFIFDLITEPLGLPIEWYYEWIILLVIGEIAYRVAYDKVGVLYKSGSISGKSAGSFFHWIIRTVVFVAIWAITYGVIWIGKFVMAHKIQVAIGICNYRDRAGLHKYYEFSGDRQIYFRKNDS